MLKPSPILTAALLSFAVCGCGKDGDAVPIDGKRVLVAPRPEQRMAAGTKMRFSGPSMDSGGGSAQAAMPTLAWDLPAGWMELAPTQMRTGNFSVPAFPGLECTITILPGGGGGLAANLNRWRKQMGLPALTEADIAALPRVKLLGADAASIVMDGTYSGGQEGASPGFTMAAVVLDRPGAAIFVKMVGPTAAVRAEIGHFRALCASLRDTSATGPAAGGADTGSMKWTAPAGWTQGPAKQMRVVTFVPKDAPGVECYVTVLSGTGGGLTANLNRWRDQFGLPPLTAEEIAALPTLPVLGRPARMIEIDGGKSGLFGLVCELGTQTVFVKMTGPMESLRAERERFIAFCKSLS